MTSIFHGVIPALMTEMKEGGAIDHEATSRHLESCLSAGVNGFVMLGTLGENSSLRSTNACASRFEPQRGNVTRSVPLSSMRMM